MNLKVVFTILKLVVCHKVFKKSYQSSPLMLYGQTNKNITTLLYSSKALSMFLKWATSETSYLLRTLMTTKRFFFKSSTTTDSSTFVRIHTLLSPSATVPRAAQMSLQFPDRTCRNLPQPL